jgi:hypothetical protein
MAKRIELKSHLTNEELRKRYQGCQKPQKKVRWQALSLILNGQIAAEAAQKVGRVANPPLFLVQLGFTYLQDDTIENEIQFNLL